MAIFSSEAHSADWHAELRDALADARLPDNPYQAFDMARVERALDAPFEAVRVKRYLDRLNRLARG